MASLIHFSKSPYYYIRVYNKYGETAKDKYVTIPTKIRISKPDQILIEKKKKGGRLTLKGTPETKELLKQLEIAKLQDDVKSRLGLKLERRITYSLGLQEFLTYKPSIKQSTIQAYNSASKLWLKVIGDKIVKQYTELDYVNFVNYLSKNKYSAASKANYLRHLYVIFNYLEKKGYGKNIITRIRPPKGIPVPIPKSDLKTILEFYRLKDKKQYDFVMFQFLTGFRPSTSILLTWNDIDLEAGVIYAYNQKTSTRFTFSIYSALRQHILNMERKGKRLFQYASANGIKFWRKYQLKLFKAGKIRQTYQLYQLRDSFASYFLNQGLGITEIKELLNHTDIKVTEGYAHTSSKGTRNKMDNISLDILLN